MERNDEPISALADDELDGRGAEFLIRRISTDPALELRWQRIHLLRACLQREFTAPVALVERVSAAIEGEPLPKGTGTWAAGLARAGFGGAIAAGVALVAVIGLGNRLEPESAAPESDVPGFVSQTNALDRQFNPTAVPAGFGAERASPGAAGPAGASQRQINRYMIRHSQLAGDSGFISFTPVLTAPSWTETAVVAPPSEASVAPETPDEATGTESRQR